MEMNSQFDYFCNLLNNETPNSMWSIPVMRLCGNQHWCIQSYARDLLGSITGECMWTQRFRGNRETPQRDRKQRSSPITGGTNGQIVAGADGSGPVVGIPWCAKIEPSAAMDPPARSNPGCPPKTALPDGVSFRIFPFQAMAASPAQPAQKEPRTRPTSRKLTRKSAVLRIADAWMPGRFASRNWYLL